MQPDKVLEIVPGLKQEWFADGRMVGYKLTAMSPTILEAWSGCVLATIEAWDKSKPYLALHDLTAPTVPIIYGSLTSYDMLNIGVTMKGRRQVEDVFNAHSSFRAFVSIVFNLTLSGHIGKTLLNYYIDQHPSVKYKTFYSRERSMAWLLSQISPADNVTA